MIGSIIPLNFEAGVSFMSVMRTVSTWRCKCGESVKAIGESESDGSRGRVMVRCPKCGTQQLLHVDKIISVTTENVGPGLSGAG